MENRKINCLRHFVGEMLLGCSSRDGPECNGNKEIKFNKQLGSGILDWRVNYIKKCQLKSWKKAFPKGQLVCKKFEKANEKMDTKMMF